MYIRIGSTQNERVKQLVRLMKKSRERRKTGLFVIEGMREMKLALRSGYEITDMFIHPDTVHRHRIEEIIQMSGVSARRIFILEKPVFAKISYRDANEGIVAVAKAKTRFLNDLTFDDNALILVLEAPEKPGNTGAVLRTADVLGADAVIISNPLSDIYHPNTIRSGVGAVFTVDTATGSNEEVYDFLMQNGFHLLAAVLDDDTIVHTKAQYKGKTALLVGTESSGLTGFWKQRAHEKIKIPLRGRIDSLNLSVSAALLMYEALMQKKRQPKS